VEEEKVLKVKCSYTLEIPLNDEDVINYLKNHSKAELRELARKRFEINMEYVLNDILEIEVIENA
jgi:hypothetical protein